MAPIPSTSDSTFDADVLRADVPVLVDFGAEWCHPCKQLEPLVEELASEWQGRVRVLRLDIDQNVGTTMKYGILGVPTLILFVAGEPRERVSGYQPKHRIIQKLAPFLPTR